MRARRRSTTPVRTSHAAARRAARASRTRARRGGRRRRRASRSAQKKRVVDRRRARRGVSVDARQSWSRRRSSARHEARRRARAARARSCARQRSSGSAAPAPTARAPPRLDHRRLPHCEARARISERISRRGRGVRRHLRAHGDARPERAPISSEYAIRRSCLLQARAHVSLRVFRQQQRDGERAAPSAAKPRPALLRVLGHGLARRDAVRVFALHVQRRHPAPS